jgi:hypothetical protein
MVAAKMLVVTVALVAVAPLAHAAREPFEGTIQLRLRDGLPQGADYAMRGGRARVDVPSVRGLHDLHFAVDLAARDATPPAGVKLDRSSRARAVAGQRCEPWRLTQGDDVVDACVIPDAGWMDPRRLVGAEIPAWSRMLEVEKAFPISVTETVGGHPTFAMWATDVRREPVSDDRLVVPPRTARVRPSL